MPQIAQVEHGTVIGCYGLSGGVVPGTPDYEEVMRQHRAYIDAYYGRKPKAKAKIK